MKPVGDAHLIVDLEGQRITKQMRYGATIEDSWLELCSEYALQGGRRARIGRVYAFLIMGEPLAENTPIEWIGYRVAPETVDEDEDHGTDETQPS